MLKILGVHVRGDIPERRINPRIYQCDYLHLTKLLELLCQEIEHLKLGADAILLDIGSGGSPYKALFKEKVKTVLSLDQSRLNGASVVGDGNNIPLRESCLDLVLCTQVLEHVERPKDMIDEIYRVLRPGGVLLLSTHGIWELHSVPKDYWRFNPDGFETLFQPYKKVKILPNGGDFLCFFQMANLMAAKFFWGIFKLPVIIIWIINNLIGRIMDKYSKGKKLVVNYLVVAIK